MPPALRKEDREYGGVISFPRIIKFHQHLTPCRLVQSFFGAGFIFVNQIIIKKAFSSVGYVYHDVPH
jgi:hypothetical protein